MATLKSIIRSSRLNSARAAAEFDQTAHTIPPAESRRGDDRRVLLETSGWIVLVIGCSGLIGHALDTHLLKSFLHWRTEEIPLSTSCAFILLGLGITQASRLERREVSRWLLYSVMGIGLFNIFHHYLLAGFHLLLPLVDPFREVPMAFLSAVQLTVVSFGLLYFNKRPPSESASVGLGIIGVWLVATVLFAIIGYWSKLPVLFSYSQSIPSILGFSVIGIAFTQESIWPPGLLSPLKSSLKGVRALAVVSLLSTLMILVAGIVIVHLFNTYALNGITNLNTDQFLIGFELATLVLAILVLTLSMRVLFFYETSLRTQAELQTLNMELEARVKERTAELEKVSLQKSRVLSMVSHDLKTPLSAVERFAAILSKETNHFSETQREMIGYIRECIGQMRVMVTDVLDKARIEAGKVTPQPEVIPAATFLERLLTTVRPLAEEREIQIHTEVQPGLEVKADPILLQQILLNLLSNAVKYNKRNGEIWLRAFLEPSSTDTAVNQVVFEVQDTGIGIPEIKLPHIFEEFYRIGAGMNTIEGTGLGLASTKILAELHGGQVEVTSQEGVGSTFIVRLPQ